jgi:RHS repeat-associated protein
VDGEDLSDPTPDARVELVSERTQNAKHFKLPDGTGMVRLYSAPVHYEDAQGKWKPIDTTLIEQADGSWRSAAGEVRVRAAESSDATALGSVASDGATAGFGLPEAADKVGVVHDDKITYREVMPGVDLALEATNTGLKESIVLKAPPSEVDPTYEFRLDLAGLTARTAADGQIELRDRSGSTVFVIPQGFMYDSTPASDGGPAIGEVAIDLEERGSQQWVVVTPDATWLHDPSTVYPVVVDPTLKRNDATADTYVGSDITGARNSDSWLQVGSPDGSVRRRTYLKFNDVQQLAGLTITDVELSLWQNGSNVCYGRLTHVHRPQADADGQWTALGIRWTNQPAMNWDVLAANNTNRGGSGCAEGDGRVSLGDDGPQINNPNNTLTSTVKSWANGQLGNNGLMLRAPAGSEDVASYYKRFASDDTVHTPWLDVSYNAAPAFSGLAPNDGHATNVAEPALSGTYESDPPEEGDWGQLRYQVWNSTKSQLVAVGQGQQGPDETLSRWFVREDGPDVPAGPGNSGTPTWNLGTGPIPEGTYYWRAIADDEVNPTNHAAAWAAASWRRLTIDRTGPVVALDYPYAGATVAGTQTLTATATDSHVVTGVEFLVDGNVVGSDATVPYAFAWNTTLVSDGSHEVKARATDASGNSLDSESIALRIANNGPLVSISSPPPGAKVAGSVKVSAAAFDDRRVDKVEFFKDEASIGTDAIAPFDVTWNTTMADNGAHTLTAIATDDAANQTTSSGVEITVENSNPPTTSITAPINNETISGVATVTADAHDDFDIERVEFYFDGNRIGEPDATAPYSVPWDTLDPGQPAYDGTHELTARAYDSHAQMTISAPVAVTVANTVGTKFQAGIAAATALPQAITYDPAKSVQDKHGVNIAISNNSAVTLKNTDVVLRYRWYTPEGALLSDSADIPLGSDLLKGKSRTLGVQVEPPALPDGVDKAQYRLRFDLFDKPSSSWFAAKGNPPLDNPVIVNKAITATALGLERYYGYEGEPVGAGMVHLTNVASGNSLLQWVPFSSPGRGLSTVVSLGYNSLEDHSESPVGNNFSLSVSSLTRFGLPLDIHPNKADDLASPSRNAKWIEFTDGDGTTHRFTANTNGGWDEPRGVHLYLRQQSATDPTRKWALTRPDRVTFFYNDQGFPTGVQDKNENRLDFKLEDVPPAEDPGGVKKRITTITDAAGLGSNPAPNRKFTIDYYSKNEVAKPQVRGKIEKIIDHNGSELGFDYYEDGNLLRITQKGGTKADGSALASRSFVFTYTTSDGSGPAIPNVNERVDPNPRTSPQSSRLFSVRDPRGNETTFAYFGPGSSQRRWKLEARTNRNGDTTSFAYDLSAQTTTVTPPAPGGISRATKHHYDSDGKVDEITNAKNEIRTLVWNADRHVSKVYDLRTAGSPPGDFVEYAYNHNGYVTDVHDQLRNHTALKYENKAVDENDVPGKWKAGRIIPHISQLRTKTSPRGTATEFPEDDFQWTFDYDDEGNLVMVTEPEGDPRYTTRYDYNADGTLAKITDPITDAGPGPNPPPNPRETIFNTYDANGLATKVTDAAGKITRFGFDDDGLVEWIQDPLHADDTGGYPPSYRTYFEYDSFHRLGRQSTPKLSSGNGPLVWSAADYDANDNVTVQLAPEYGFNFVAGPKTEMTYDSMDRVKTSNNPQDEETRLSYDAAGRVTDITSPEGVATAEKDQDHALFFDYDSLDRVVRRIRYDTDESPAVAVITHLCYDVAGDLISSTAPKANVASVVCAAPPRFTTRFEYDDAHRRIKVFDPQGHPPTVVSYDANGNVKTSTDPLDNTTIFTYDQRDLLITTEEPFNEVRDVTTRYEYDALGRLAKQMSPRAVDAASGSLATRYFYDPLGRLKTVELPSEGTQEKFYLRRDYDDNGNLKTTTLPDPAATLAEVPDSSRTDLRYFDTGWIKSHNDHVNPESVFDYNARGQQLSRTFAEGALQRTESWGYASDGPLLEHGDKRDDKTVYDYNANNQLTVARDFSGITQAGEKPVRTEVAYDALDRVRKVRHRKQTDDAETTDYTFTRFGYDLNSNVETRVEDGTETPEGLEDPDGKTGTFGYDDGDWLTSQVSELDSGCQKVVNTYTAIGLEETRQISRASQACSENPNFAPKQSTRWDYFKNAKLMKMTTRSGALGTAPIVESHTVDYTAAAVYMNGHRVSDTFFRLAPQADAPCRTEATQCTATYAYDALDRLTRELKDRGTTTEATDYELDPAGNVRKEVTGSSTTFFTYAGQRLEKIATGSEDHVVARHFYDDGGNLDCVTTGDFPGTSCPEPASGELVKDYHYDALFRLERFVAYAGTTPTDDTSYDYDALDRVIKEVEGHSLNGTPKNRTTSLNYLGLTNLVTSETFAGDRKSLSKSYTYDASGNRMSLTDTPADGGDTKTYTYGYDVHGSVSLLLENAAGDATDNSTVTASYGYDAYGDEDQDLTSDPEEVTGPGGTDDPLNAYRYTAKRFDSGSDTLDMGARRFGPDTARFLQPDLFKGALANLGLSSDPLTGNRYALAGGNPVSYIEWDGHVPICDGDCARTNFCCAVLSSRESAGPSIGDVASGLVDAGKERIRHLLLAAIAVASVLSLPAAVACAAGAALGAVLSPRGPFRRGEVT